MRSGKQIKLSLCAVIVMAARSAEQPSLEGFHESAEQQSG
jgi:hypothetical protein